MLNSSSSELSSASRFFLRGFDDLQHRADILLHRETAKDRRFLRQIADAEPGALIHRQLGDVVAIEFDGAAIGLDQAGDHVKHRGLAGAVRAQQTHRLAAADIDADAAHDLAAAETLFHAMHSQIARPLRQPWARSRHWSWTAAGAAFPAAGTVSRFRQRRAHRGLAAIGGASRTGLVSISPMVSPSAVMSARVRANPGGLRFAGRRRNMPSKSTIPASLKPFTVIPRPAAGNSIRSRNMNEWMSLAQRNTLDLRRGPPAGPLP